eukprot:3479586-Pyramimonas_sp.AAC.1
MSKSSQCLRALYGGRVAPVGGLEHCPHLRGDLLVHLLRPLGEVGPPIRHGARREAKERHPPLRCRRPGQRAVVGGLREDENVPRGNLRLVNVLLVRPPVLGNPIPKHTPLGSVLGFLGGPTVTVGGMLEGVVGVS